MWPFRKVPEPTAPAPSIAESARAGMEARGILVSTGDQAPDLAAAKYRIGAILRDREQRAGGDPHPDAVLMAGEAMRLGGTLVERGVWGLPDLRLLVQRMELG